METKAENIFNPQDVEAVALPLFEGNVPAGFPSPAADYEESSLDLNKYLVKNPAATYFVRVSGESMTGAGIFTGDMLIVDRSLDAKNGSVVIAALDGELMVKRIRIKGSHVSLASENERYKPIDVSGQEDFAIWGVVTNVIHAL
ncbi:MAG: LexA family protein [Phycisphaerae bacterium]